MQIPDRWRAVLRRRKHNHQPACIQRARWKDPLPRLIRIIRQRPPRQIHRRRPRIAKLDPVVLLPVLIRQPRSIQRQDFINHHRSRTRRAARHAPARPRKRIPTCHIRDPMPRRPRKIHRPRRRLRKRKHIGPLRRTRHRRRRHPVHQQIARIHTRHTLRENHLRLRQHTQRRPAGRRHLRLRRRDRIRQHKRIPARRHKRPRADSRNPVIRLPRNPHRPRRRLRERKHIRPRAAPAHRNRRLAIDRQIIRTHPRHRLIKRHTQRRKRPHRRPVRRRQRRNRRRRKRRYTHRHRGKKEQKTKTGHQGFGGHRPPTMRKTRPFASKKFRFGRSDAFSSKAKSLRFIHEPGR